MGSLHAFKKNDVSVSLLKTLLVPCICKEYISQMGDASKREFSDKLGITYQIGCQIVNKDISSLSIEKLLIIAYKLNINLSINVETSKGKNTLDVFSFIKDKISLTGKV